MFVLSDMYDYVPPTKWERKERDGLLAQEPAEWREKRLIAEDPDTTGETLARLVEVISDTCAYCTMGEVPYANKLALLVDAVLAHPNTPPRALLRLVYLFASNNYRPFCRNPIVPFLPLEMPDFWEEMGDEQGGDFIPCVLLLKEEDLPRAAARAFSLCPYPFVAEAAAFHIVLSGEVKTHEEGLSVLRASGFPQFVAGHSELKNLTVSGLANGGVCCWERRLYAALHLPFSRDPLPLIPGYDKAFQEQWSRSPLDLLQYLAHDGNRLVRWAAQTRLADPSFVFPLAD